MNQGKYQNFTYEIIMSKVTKKLGENYLYYQPNFTKYYDDKEKLTYTMLDDVVPKIYTQGVRYDFIKPK